MKALPKQKTDTKMPFCWAVTGTFHGSIVEAKTEGGARRAFHKFYKGESIIHVKKSACVF